MKAKEIKQMSNEEKDKKLKELKLELVKTRVSLSKGGSSKIKSIKKLIARILTLNK